jgi:hypothetical protein
VHDRVGERFLQGQRDIQFVIAGAAKQADEAKDLVQCRLDGADPAGDGQSEALRLYALVPPSALGALAQAVAELIGRRKQFAALAASIAATGEFPLIVSGRHALIVGQRGLADKIT